MDKYCFKYANLKSVSRNCVRSHDCSYDVGRKSLVEYSNLFRNLRSCISVYEATTVEDNDTAKISLRSYFTQPMCNWIFYSIKWLKQILQYNGDYSHVTFIKKIIKIIENFLNSQSYIYIFVKNFLHTWN